MATALTLLADGLEEIEAITTIDVLRRADVEVTTAGLQQQTVKGAHGITFEADTTLENVQNELYEAVVLPGGEPGSTNLAEHSDVPSVLRRHDEQDKLLGAICAAPKAFSRHGLISDHAVTSHPSVREQLDCQEYKTDPVVESDNIITSRGPGTAIPFSLCLVSKLVDDQVSRKLADHMEFHYAGWEV